VAPILTDLVDRRKPGHSNENPRVEDFFKESTYNLGMYFLASEKKKFLTDNMVPRLKIRSETTQSQILSLANGLSYET
jgi:hypothetical protein